MKRTRALAFVCAVSVNVVTPVLGANAPSRGSIQIVAVAKLDPSPVLESIVVGDPAPHIEPALVPLRGRSGVLIEFSEWDALGPLAYVHSGRDRNAAFFVSVSEIGFVRLFREITPDKPFDVFSREVSGIPDYHVAGNQFFASAEWADAARLYTQIGTLERSRVFELTSGHPSSRGEQADSRDSQNQSENNKPKREIRDRIAVRLFPKTVVLAMLTGAFLGAVTVSVILWLIM